MTLQSVQPEAATEETVPSHASRGPRTSRILGNLDPRKVSALYVLLAIILVFSIWVPDTFLRTATVRQVFNSNAVIGLAALALAIPLAARVFDLSFAYTMSLSGVTAAHFIVDKDWPVWLAVGAALFVALIVGVINAFVVVVMRVDSMIGTLATGSIIQAFITYVTNEIPITNAKLFGTFSDIGQKDVGGFILPVYYMFGIAALTYFVMEHTAVGRRIYATGFNTEAARLTGIKTKRIQFCSLLVSAVVAGWAGVVLAAVLGTGSPTAGTPYLLPAFAAAFLGATQIRPGRFNARGTILGVVTLGAGITGLSLATAPTWAANMFTGIVLIAALATTTVQRKPKTPGAGWRSRFRRS